MKQMWMIALALYFFAGLPAALDKSEPMKVGAVFALTGPVSFPGAPEEKTAKIRVDKIHERDL